jgi:hypothetical protein
MKTKVLFLIEQEEDCDDVFAYFPEEVHNGIIMTCYAHIGQHSACHPDYARDCKEATPEQYNDLKEELEKSVGYELEILNQTVKQD